MGTRGTARWIASASSSPFPLATNVTAAGGNGSTFNAALTMTPKVPSDPVMSRCTS